MVKRITVAACALFIMLGFIAGGISKLYEERELKKKEQETKPASAPIEETDEATENYLLKVEDGIVVVFSENDIMRPIIVTDIYASTLRNFDREQLSKGIVASGEAELQSLLEDFSS
ncbi:MAG: hypothetical protein IKU65_04515 [Oscillospiraceae bacterium]|nr:hypothetical protein [Oscillospiraceae bacterium]